MIIRLVAIFLLIFLPSVSAFAVELRDINNQIAKNLQAQAINRYNLEILKGTNDNYISTRLNELEQKKNTLVFSGSELYTENSNSLQTLRFLLLSGDYQGVVQKVTPQIENLDALAVSELLKLRALARLQLNDEAGFVADMKLALQETRKGALRPEIEMSCIDAELKKNTDLSKVERHFVIQKYFELMGNTSEKARSILEDRQSEFQQNRSFDEGAAAAIFQYLAAAQVGDEAFVRDFFYYDSDAIKVARLIDQFQSYDSIEISDLEFYGHSITEKNMQTLEVKMRVKFIGSSEPKISVFRMPMESDLTKWRSRRGKETAGVTMVARK